MDIENEKVRFFTDWDIDFDKKLIFLKKRSFFKRALGCIVRPKYPVLFLYRFARHHESTSTGISYPLIVDRDNLPKIDDLPTRFVLNEPWKVLASDLKTLYLGPLTQNKNILVPAFPKNGFFTTMKEVVFVSVSVLAVIGGAISFIVQIWKWLNAMSTLV